MSSAANLNGEAESPTTSSHSASARPDPIAIEIAVNATGARPPEGNAPRELFTEETATVLVFHDGAVIRLSSAVLQGQLVFLTHKQSNLEVVCQVVRKRASGPTSSYVELQFTEPHDDFWGIEFERTSGAASPQLIPAPSPEMAAAAAEATEFVLDIPPAVENGGAPSKAPSAEEVELLREEVEALRKQLLSLQSAPALQVPALQAPPPPVSAPIIPMSLPAALPAHSEDARRTQAPSSSSLSEPRFRGDQSAERDPEEETIQGLLPEPNLDFSNTPARAVTHNASSVYAAPGPRSGRLLLVLVSLLLVVGGVGVAWSLGFLQFLHTSRPAAPVVSNWRSAKPAASSPSTSSSKSNAKQPALGASSSSTDSSNVAPVPSDSPAATPVASVNAPPEASVASNDVAERPAKDASNHRSAARDKKVSSASSSVPAPRETASDDAPIVPAQLLKSVPLVYPPEAMRNFITGDVRLDALVDANGRVKSVEVLVGPAQLHQAAIEAIKQYQYSPATKGSRPVDSHVTVTIKFWYNP